MLLLVERHFSHRVVKKTLSFEKNAKIFGGIKFYTYICTQKGVYADVIDYIWTEILLLFGCT